MTPPLGIEATGLRVGAAEILAVALGGTVPLRALQLYGLALSDGKRLQLSELLHLQGVAALVPPSHIE